MKNNLQMVDLANPAGSLIMAEPLVNPVAQFAPRGEQESAPGRIAELQR
ncbi:hypothetical protein [Pseudomonas sediminis]